MLGHAIDYIKKHRSLLFLIVPAFILQMVVMMPSGTDFCIGDRCGIHFWGVHSHDAMWHLEIASVSFKTFPFQVPTYAGSDLSGYNILMDFVIYLISFLGIPPIFTLFKIVPVLWFIFYTLVGITLARAIKDDLRFVFILLFTLYFADHVGYFLHLYHEGSLFKGGQSFSLQSMTALLNTQFALTLPLVMMQLVLIKKKIFSWRGGLVMFALVFFILGLKFYGGVISAFIAGCYILEALIQQKSWKPIAKLGVPIAVAAVLSIILFYNPFAAQESGDIFTVSPFATVHSVIEAPDMIYKPDLVNARYYLYEQGVFSKRLMYIELLSTFYYFLLNFGTRTLGIIYFLGRVILRKSTRLELYIMGGVLLGFVLNIMLIQKGDWWNTVQFGYYAIFLANIFLAKLLYDLVSWKNKTGLIVAILIIILTVPNILRMVKTFTASDTLYIPRAEIDAMNVLKKAPDGVVFNSFEASGGYPFLDYKISGYVAAFTGKPLYLAHLGPLNIIGVDASDRLERLKSNDCTILEEVDYIYYVKSHDQMFLQSCKILIQKKFEEIFDNSEVKIYEKR